MSTIRQVQIKCAMCQKESEQIMLGSTSAFGAMDLDTRPPALARHMNGCYVQECPHCGYANYSIDTPTAVSPEFFQSEPYLTIAKQDLPGTAISFCKMAMLGAEEKDASKEFWGYMRAAWVCDDENRELSARVSRLCALQTLEQNTDAIIGDSDTAAMMRADLLRRTHQFDEVVKQFKDFRSDNAFLQKLMQYELRLAKNKDHACHRVDEA